MGMLILTRQRDETVVIICPDGTEVLAMICDIRGDRVRTGYTAPPEVQIHRLETWERIKRENRAAAEVKPEDVAALDPSKRK